MAVAFGSSVGAVQGGATDWALTLPAGTAAGDLLLAMMLIDDQGPTVTPASGWAVPPGCTVPQPSGGTDCSSMIYYKLAGASEPNPTFGFSANRDGAWVTARYTGVHQTTPIHQAASNNDGPGTANHVSATLTPTVDGCMIVHFVGVDESGTKPQPYYIPNTGAGWSALREMVEGSSQVQLGFTDQLQATAGPISHTMGTTPGQDDEATMHIIAIAPAAAAPAAGGFADRRRPPLGALLQL